MDLDKKQDQRRRFLRKLYEVTGGHRFTFAADHEIGEAIGLTPEETDLVADYLAAQGRLKYGDARRRYQHYACRRPGGGA